MELISIIIPTYQRSHLIEEAVINCQEQSYSSIEIIIIDDNGINSLDQEKTQKVIKRLANRFSNIVYHPLVINSGACFARNKGVEISQGDYISFYDDDDRWHKDKLAKQMACFCKNEDASMVACSFFGIKNKEKKYVQIDLPLENQYQFFIDNLNKNFGMPLTLYKKEAFIDAGMLDTTFPSAQDLDLNLRILKKHKVYCLQEPLVFVDLSEENRISTNYTKKILGYLRIIEKYKNLLRIEGLKFLNHRILYLSFCIKKENSFKEAYSWFKANNLLNSKYIIFNKIRNIPSLRKFTCWYMGARYE